MQHILSDFTAFDCSVLSTCVNGRDILSRYMKGGVASGFNHVEQKVTQRLLHVKGRHHVRAEEVEKSWNSFNDGDVFILDLGKVQFVWMGKESSRTERMKVSTYSYVMCYNLNLFDEYAKQFCLHC